MWNEMIVKWQFTGRLCGNTPLDLNIWEKWYKDWLAKRVTPPSQRTVQEIQEDVYDAIVEGGQLEHDTRGLVGFAKQNGVLVVGGYTVRSHIKDCAQTISRYLVGKIKGEASFMNKIKAGTYVKNDWITLRNKDGKYYSEPDGILEKPITATIPTTGQRITTIKRFCYLDQPQMDFTLLVLPSIKKVDIEKVFEYGAVHGYLGERAVGQGKYIYEIEEIQK